MTIKIEVLSDENIEQCRDLCNELMSFQKSLAIISPAAFDNMNFETRLKASFESSPINQIIIAKDNDIPIGYVFSTIENVNGGDKSHIPDWAPVNSSHEVKGFYPDWSNFPSKVGCINHLFFKESYRGMGIGSKLLNMAMEWIESFPDVNVSFVYISNGNDAALDFYIKHGFTFSHDVFGGFIKAAYKFKDR